jgi:drug/metabolite transporter (DMT)-like permease
VSLKDKDILLHVGLLLLFSALMGGLFPLVKIAEETITPITLAMSRAILAALLLLFFVGIVMKRNLALLITQWRTFTIMGVMLSAFFIALPEAEEHISASLSSLLTCVIPISTFLIATLVLRWEKFTLPRLGGSALALAGVAMFIGVDRIQLSHAQLIGVCVITCGYFIYAMYLMYSRACEFDPFLTATGTMVYMSLILSVAAFTQEQPLELRPSMEAVLAVLAIGVFSTGLTYVLVQYVIAKRGAIFAATSGYFIPVFAIVASYFLVGETIVLSQLIGLGITLVGAWLVNRNPGSLPTS